MPALANGSPCQAFPAERGSKPPRTHGGLMGPPSGCQGTPACRLPTTNAFTGAAWGAEVGLALRALEGAR
jgi:hypothetical protein